MISTNLKAVNFISKYAVQNSVKWWILAFSMITMWVSYPGASSPGLSLLTLSARHTLDRKGMNSDDYVAVVLFNTHHLVWSIK